MLSERSQSQKATEYVIPFIPNAPNRQIHGDGKSISLVPRAGGKTEDSGMTANGEEVIKRF